MATLTVAPQSATDAAGKQFYAALQQKAMAAVESIIKSKLYPIEFPSQGDFKYNWQNANQVFNESTFDYISAQVKPGDIAGSVQIGSAGSFPNAYVELLNAIIYSLSTSDQSRLQNAQSNASTQQMTVISDYQTTFGVITDAQMKEAGVTTKIDYVIGYELGTQWSDGTKPLSYTQMANARNLQDLLPRMPMSGQQVVTDVSVYLNLMAPVNGLNDQVQYGTWMLQQLKNNAQAPNDSNGGMKTVNPNSGSVSSGENVGYEIPSSQASITNDMQNTSRTIKIEMSTSRASGGELQVNIKGQAGFSVGSFLRFSVSGGTEYNMSKISGTSEDMSVTITYAGYSVVPIEADAWQQATNKGWFSDDPIAQAVANGNRDVTGFKFLNEPPFKLVGIANGGNFGMLTNLLIANYPTISITYHHADFSSFKESFKQQVSGNLTLFGFIKLGSFSEGTYQSKYAQGSDNSSFTVTFGASTEVVSVPQLQKQAYVLGGAVSNPGVTN